MLDDIVHQGYTRPEIKDISFWRFNKIGAGLIVSQRNVANILYHRRGLHFLQHYKVSFKISNVI